MFTKQALIKEEHDINWTVVDQIMPEMIGIFKRKVFTPGFPWFQSLVRQQNRIPALQFILGVNSIKLLQVYKYLSLFLDSKPIATLANYIY